jgi:NADPH:quinone reductase
MPEGTSARAAPGAFINPLTVLCMVETLRRSQHAALVHTAAAPNLGQMLVRLCKAVGILLVNVVRSAAQVQLLRGLGADNVLDSTAPEFDDALADATSATVATLAFDTVGSGTLAATVLAAMERVEREKLPTFSRYCSPVPKPVYIYGLPDPGPRIIQPNGYRSRCRDRRAGRCDS